MIVHQNTRDGHVDLGSNIHVSPESIIVNVNGFDLAVNHETAIAGIAFGLHVGT